MYTQLPNFDPYDKTFFRYINNIPEDKQSKSFLSMEDIYNASSLIFSVSTESYLNFDDFENDYFIDTSGLSKGCVFYVYIENEIGDVSDGFYYTHKPYTEDVLTSSHLSEDWLSVVADITIVNIGVRLAQLKFRDLLCGLLYKNYEVHFSEVNLVDSTIGSDILIESYRLEQFKTYISMLQD